MEQWSNIKLAFTFVILHTLAIDAFSQDKVLVEKNIEVGMWVNIPSCQNGKEHFVSMDLYKKTRYKSDELIKIDSSSGEGVFEYFFTPGDFDAKRLPCSYGKQQYKVAALHVFEKDGAEKRVMILYTKDKLSVIWVEFDKAVELEEIFWE